MQLNQRFYERVQRTEYRKELYGTTHEILGQVVRHVHSPVEQVVGRVEDAARERLLRL